MKEKGGGEVEVIFTSGMNSGMFAGSKGMTW